MNAKFFKTGSRNLPYYAVSSFDEIYQLGYKHGYNDASNKQDYEADYEFDEDFDEDEDYDYSKDYKREYSNRKALSTRNMARDNRGRFVSSEGTRGAARKVTAKSDMGTSRRGFASMSKEERTRIARMGGLASHGGGRSSTRVGFGGRRST